MLGVEAMKLAVPIQELRMRMICIPQWGDDLASWIEDRFNTATIIDLAVDDNLVIVGNADQTAIEHPMRRPRKRKTVADGIRPAMLNRPNVSRFRLESPSTVDETPPCDSAASVISVENRAAKSTVTERAINERLDDLPLNSPGQARKIRI